MADITLLLYRILPFDKARARLVQSDGGTVSGGIEVNLIQVETGASLFRQTVTAKTFFPSPNKGVSWREEGVMRAHANRVPRKQQPTHFRLLGLPSESTHWA